MATDRKRKVLQEERKKKILTLPPDTKLKTIRHGLQLHKWREDRRAGKRETAPPAVADGQSSQDEALTKARFVLEHVTVLAWLRDLADAVLDRMRSGGAVHAREAWVLEQHCALLRSQHDLAIELGCGEGNVNQDRKRGEIEFRRCLQIELRDRGWTEEQVQMELDSLGISETRTASPLLRAEMSDPSLAELHAEITFKKRETE